MSPLLQRVLSLVLLTLSVVPPARGELPPNVVDHDLSDAGSCLSIRLVSVPYYLGDQIVLEATVRNTSSAPLSLPDPRALFVDIGDAPDDGVVFDATGIDFVKHQCPNLGQIDDVAQGPLECIDHLRKRSARLAPGEMRTATYVSGIPHRLLKDPRLEGKSPVVLGVRVSSHGVLPDRWFRFRVYRFQDPIKSQVLVAPTNRHKSLFFTVPAGTGRFVVYALGTWYPATDGEPPAIDAAYINKSPHTDLIAVVTKPDPIVSFDEQGRVLVDGVPAPPRTAYQFEKRSVSRWALSEERPASTSPSNR